MNDIEEYFRNTIIFVNSLVIKIDEIRIHQNYHTYVKYGLTPPIRSSSKYYQNITAVLNKNDYNVVLSNGDILTRDYLNNNTYLKETLEKYELEFDTLVLANPGMSDYIRGCINNVTLAQVEASEDYKILYYKKGYLQDNELSIIPKLEKFIYNYFNTYGNRKFMIDELFLPAQLSGLYTALVLYIITLKFDNIKTHKVDNFHLANSLLSYKDTYNYSKIFDLSTNIWLYGNIDRLKHNIGKNKILDEVLYKVLDTNNYGIGNLQVEGLVPLFNQTDFEDYTKEFYSNDYRLTIKDSNSSVYNISNKAYTLDAFSSVLINNKLISNYSKSNLDIEDTYIKNQTGLKFTDIFILDQPEHIRTHEYNMFTFLISNLIYLIRSKKPTFVIDYYNPLDTKLYKLNVKDIENIIIYSLFKLYNIPDGDMSLKCSGIYAEDTFNKNSVLQKTWYKDRISPVLDYIINVPNLNLYPNNPLTLTYKLKAIRQLDLRTWFVLSNIVDNTAKTDVKYMISNILTSKEFTYNTTTIASYLNSHKLSGFLNNVTIGSLSDLLTKTTGLEVDATKILTDKFKKVINFFDNLTSYTIDLTMDNEFLDKLIANSSSGGINMGYKPFLDIKDTSIKFYEELDTYIEATGFLDTVLDYTLNNTMLTSVKDITNTLPCLVSSDIIQPVITHSSSKLLRGKKYVVSSFVLDMLDNELFNNLDYNTFDTNIVKDTLPVYGDSSSIDINNIVSVEPFIKYRGVIYTVRGMSTYSNRDNNKSISYLNIDNITRVTGSYVPTVELQPELDVIDTLSINKRLDRNKYKVGSNVVNIDESNIYTNIIDTMSVSSYDNNNVVTGTNDDEITMDLEVTVKSK